MSIFKQSLENARREHKSAQLAVKESEKQHGKPSRQTLSTLQYCIDRLALIEQTYERRKAPAKQRVTMIRRPHRGQYIGDAK